MLYLFACWCLGISGCSCGRLCGRYLSVLLLLLEFFLHLSTMLHEFLCSRKLPQPVTHHVLCHQHIYVCLAIVDRKSKTQHLWRDDGRATPSLDRTRLQGILARDLGQEPLVYIWTFFDASSQYF
jgi:hypothetical protein